MNIKDVISRATPGPLHVNDGFLSKSKTDGTCDVLVATGVEGSSYDLSLLAHWYNMGSKLLDALRSMTEMAGSVRGGGYLSIRDTKQKYTEARDTIREAEEGK